MLSQFAQWDDSEKRLFIAKIIHQINYSQANLELMESILSIWQNETRTLTDIGGGFLINVDY